MFEELHNLGHQHFQRFKEELADYRIELSPDIEIRQGKHILPYYDLKDGHIYLPNFDLENASGKLQLMFVRSLLSCNTNEEFFDFYRVAMAWMIAHEMGHHLRQRNGAFGQNLWEEEQAANYLAFSLTKHRFRPKDRAALQAFLKKAIEGLAKKMESDGIATASYGNILEGLQAAGQIDGRTMQNMEMMERLFNVNPEDVLLTSGALSHQAEDTLHLRDEAINTMNSTYTSDIARYMYYHLGWMYLGFNSREAYYVEEFARKHLNQLPDLLPTLKRDHVPNDKQVIAAFQASEETQPISATASHYFYKRYRALLVARLRTSASLTRRLQDEAVMLLEAWQAGDFDSLNYLAEIVPAQMRPLLPNAIAAQHEKLTDLEEYLPSETDRRLYRYVVGGIDDHAAATTLERLDMLEKTDIYRVLSAEVALQVIHELRVVRLAPGETIIRQGETNNDVYILGDGKLGVSSDSPTDLALSTQEFEAMQLRDSLYLNMISPGQVIGEVAFFTRESRNATVTAILPSICYVIKAADLQLFAYDDPAVLMQMAGALARRLTAMVQKYGQR
jgi:hypothetical protein